MPATISTSRSMRGARPDRGRQADALRPGSRVADHERAGQGQQGQQDRRRRIGRRAEEVGGDAAVQHRLRRAVEGRVQEAAEGAAARRWRAPAPRRRRRAATRPSGRPRPASRLPMPTSAAAATTTTKPMTVMAFGVRCMATASRTTGASRARPASLARVERSESPRRRSCARGWLADIRHLSALRHRHVDQRQAQPSPNRS